MITLTPGGIICHLKQEQRAAHLEEPNCQDDGASAQDGRGDADHDDEDVEHQEVLGIFLG